MTIISPEKMTVEENFLSMEVIWQDLCQHSLVESPDWHEFVLTSFFRSHAQLQGIKNTS